MPLSNLIAATTAPIALANPVNATVALSILVIPPLSITLLILATAVTPSPMTSPAGPHIAYKTPVPSADTSKPFRYSLKPPPLIYLSINSFTRVYWSVMVIALTANFLMVDITPKNLLPKPIALPR